MIAEKLKEDILEKAKELIDVLNKATELYDAGKPIISDREWDNMYFALTYIEEKNWNCFT